MTSNNNNYSSKSPLHAFLESSIGQERLSSSLLTVDNAKIHQPQKQKKRPRNRRITRQCRSDGDLFPKLARGGRRTRSDSVASARSTIGSSTSAPAPSQLRRGGSTGLPNLKNSLQKLPSLTLDSPVSRWESCATQTADTLSPPMRVPRRLNSLSSVSSDGTSNVSAASSTLFEDEESTACLSIASDLTGTLAVVDDSDDYLIESPIHRKRPSIPRPSFIDVAVPTTPPQAPRTPPQRTSPSAAVTAVAGGFPSSLPCWDGPDDDDEEMEASSEGGDSSSEEGSSVETSPTSVRAGLHEMLGQALKHCADLSSDDMDDGTDDIELSDEFFAMKFPRG